MKRTFCFLLALILIASYNNLFAQASGNAKLLEQQRWNSYNGANIYYPQPVTNYNNEIVLRVNAIMNVKPDVYVACFNIIQIGKSVREVNALMNNRIDSLINDLERIGLDEENIFLDFISQVPVYELEAEKKIFSKKYNEVPVGFELQKNILIKYTDGRMLDKIITSAAFYEIYDLVKVEAISLKHQEIFKRLRDESITLMETKIEKYKNLEINLDTLYKIFSENSDATYPITQYKSYQSFSRPSYSELHKNVLSMDKKRMHNHAPTTMYYHQIPYNKFDIVVNPTILEPAIQYTYNVTVKYVIKEPTTKTQKHFIMITPDGEVKTIDIR